MHAEDYDEPFVWKCWLHALVSVYLPYCLWLFKLLIVHSSLGTVLFGFKKYPEILALHSKADRLRIRDMFPTCLFSQRRKHGMHYLSCAVQAIVKSCSLLNLQREGTLYIDAAICMQGVWLRLHRWCQSVLSMQAYHSITTDRSCSSNLLDMALRAR